MPVATCDSPATRQVSIAAHTLIAQEHGERAGPHLNGIHALFGAGSLLAPAVHRALSAPLARFNPLASYWVISAAALAAAVPFLGALTASASKAASEQTAHGGHSGASSCTHLLRVRTDH